MRGQALVVLTIGALLGSTPLASAAAPPRTVRLISGGNATTLTSPSVIAVSRDGSRAIFETDEQLVPQDHNAFNDVYARDAGGALQLIGSGRTAASSSFAGMSADGDRVWYTTGSRDLAADTDTAPDVYEIRRNGTRRQISEGANVAAPATYVDASDDGDHVVFETIEPIAGTGDLDSTGRDLYDRRGDGSLHLVTPGTSLDVNTSAESRVLSADGTRATFVTNERLLPADVDAQNDSYSVPTAGGAYTLVTPGTTDSTTGIINRAGTRTWFTTTSRIVPADTDTAADVYERRSDGSVRLVSGGSANAPATLRGGLDDGSSMVFSTTESLTAADTDGSGDDLYERRGDGSLRLVSGGTTTAAAVFLGENADGSVVFQSDDNLAETDGVTDLYLRRPDGSLVLLTPSTPAAITPVPPPVSVPSATARTVMDIVDDLPGTGDTNNRTDVYEATTDGLRLLAGSVVDGTTSPTAQSADGSRVLFTTPTAIAGTADVDLNDDVYEAAFAVPVLSGVPILVGSGKAGTTHTCTAPATVGEGVTFLTTWLRETTAIAGATAKTFQPGVAEAGHDLRCHVTARNGVGADGADSTARRIGPAARAAALAGFPIVGTTLGCTAFAGATSTRYTWKRGKKTLRGRTRSAYRVAAADLGRRVTCTATGTAGALSATVALSVKVPSRCTVPGVRGLTPAAARTKLGNAGCRTTTRKVTGTGVAKGLVLGTSPAKGAKRANGARITIRVRR